MLFWDQRGLNMLCLNVTFCIKLRAMVEMIGTFMTSEGDVAGESLKNLKWRWWRKLAGSAYHMMRGSQSLE
jgi:hypothetical protein